jgi:arylsulfatase
MGPFNLVAEDMADKIARIDDIGGPDTHSNFPWGWAMAANSPLKRYKQNTHGGGVRDPLVIAGPGVGAPGLRHNFCHVSDLAPTIREVIGIERPDATEGVSFATTLAWATDTAKSVQHFEMFGHRGIWHKGWKAVAFHQPGSSFDDDQWELYNLDEDFNENHDLAASQPEKLVELVGRWWSEAEKYKVLPLDDRFAERFAENAERHRGERTQYTFWKGMGHLPSEVAPDLRSRSYSIEATVVIPEGGAEGVLIAHGDATSGYSLFIRNGHLVHDLNIGGTHQIVESDREIPVGRCTLGFRMRRSDDGGPLPHGVGTLLIDGEPAGILETDQIFWLMISWSGLDIGLDRGTTVSDYDRTGKFMGPFSFTGTLEKVTIDLDDDQQLDHEKSGQNELARD